MKLNHPLTGTVLIILCPILIASGFGLALGLSAALIAGGVVVGIIGACIVGSNS